MRIKKYTTKAGLACILAMLCVLLAGCRQAERVTTAAYEQTQRSIPVLQGFAQEEQTNDVLEAWFGPAAKALAQVESREGRVYMLSYALEKAEEDQWTLQSQIVAEGQPILALPEIGLDAQGKATFPTDSTAQALSDADFLNDVLWLRQIGIASDLGQYGRNANNEQSMAFLTALYEHVLGKQIDTQGIDSAIENEVFRKAIAVGIQDYYDSDMDMQAVYPVNNALMMHDMMLWMTNINREGYGICSQQATLEQTAALMDWMAETYQIGQGILEEGQAFATSTPRTDRAPTGFSQLAAQEKGVRTPLTREALAAFMVKAYETNIGPITVKKQDTGFYDATEETCEKAVAADLMYAYPSAATFSPELEVRMEILPEWIQDFTMSYMTAWYDPDRQLGDALYAPLTYQQMVHSVAQLGALYENRPVPQLETSQQINDRPYDWYYTQNDTGTYSEINCMPTATAMVLKWKDPDFAESVESLRNAFPKLTGGWTIYPVEKTLERHGVSYMQRQVSMQNMIEDLKAGKILFCQCNDYDVRESGHCFVIYGYKTSGDSTWFLLHDPAAIGSDAYGKEKNRAKWMEAKYCTWIVDRFSMYYLAIEP